jgi:hypothetical protein
VTSPKVPTDPTAGAIEGRRHDLLGTVREGGMKVRAALLGAGAVALGFTLTGCADPPLPNTPDAVDAAYGIPHGSVPGEYRRPDGWLTNGLLPAQPNG